MFRILCTITLMSPVLYCSTMFIFPLNRRGTIESWAKIHGGRKSFHDRKIYETNNSHGAHLYHYIFYVIAKDNFNFNYCSLKRNFCHFFYNFCKGNFFLFKNIKNILTIEMRREETKKWENTFAPLCSLIRCPFH